MRLGIICTSSRPVLVELEADWSSHANSVTKFENGDFLMSSRHTNTIYRINHLDGSIVWRLGGKFSDFQMDFNFSSQHHARVYSENSTTTILTFFDNAHDIELWQNDSSERSSGKMIALNSQPEPMTASVCVVMFRSKTRLTLVLAYTSMV